MRYFPSIILHNPGFCLESKDSKSNDEEIGIKEHGHLWGNFSEYKGHSNDLILILKRHMVCV